jgi:hypothetical protein
VVREVFAAIPHSANMRRSAALSLSLAGRTCMGPLTRYGRVCGGGVKRGSSPFSTRPPGVIFLARLNLLTLKHRTLNVRFSPFSGSASLSRPAPQG